MWLLLVEQSGLGVAARLKVLGVSCLVIDKQDRVGDSWRTRYASLRLHEPVWYDHMPYLPFPPTWPTYTPAVVSALCDRSIQASPWTLTLCRGGGQKERVIKPKHVVWACGLGGGEKQMPDLEAMGRSAFRGEVIRSSEHGSGKKWVGKKAMVVGACTSAHDIAKDIYDQGVDVTMIQRTSPYIMSVERGYH